VDSDELTRALTPIKQQLIRQSSGNMFWMRLVEGGAYDPLRVSSVGTLARDVATTSPAEVQGLAAKYLRPDRDWTMMVVPEAGAK
jgi:zinc protease